MIRRFLNTIFVLFLLTTAAYSQAQPYVILISLDGFRWDYPQKAATPNIDRIARKGVSAVSFRPVFPSSTFPCHVSMLTGLYPDRHGIIANHFINRRTGEEFSIRDSMAVRDSRWYRGEFFWETARRYGIITATYFWPGSELNLEYRRPDYFMKYDSHKPYKDRVDGVLQWLRLPFMLRPHFVTLYLEDADHIGHRYGPDSQQIDTAIINADHYIGMLLDSLKAMNMSDSVNIILLSDHGMTEIDTGKTINMNYLANDSRFHVLNYGTMMMVETIGPLLPDSEAINALYDKLINFKFHYKVYKKSGIPGYLHYSIDPNIGQILLLADPGWTFALKPGGNYGDLKGIHGYDNTFMDMQGIFYAMGPAFRKEYRTGTLDAVDIYPLLCRIFGIAPGVLTDGKIERIEQILK